jgi:AraC family transcriptional regulator
MPFGMSRVNPDGLVSPDRAAATRREVVGFAVALLPARPYEVNYVPDHHVIGFAFEPQEGMHAFACDRRRPFLADPWRLAFTPVGCDVFSASDRGGEYLVITVAPDVLARLTPGIAQERLPQLTNLSDPRFTPLATALRRAVCSSATVDDFEVEVLATQAVARVAVQVDAWPGVTGLARAMTSRRVKRVLEYIDANFDKDVRLADLARQVDLSEAYLARAFKAATGTTLHRALVERRIARARQLMRGQGRDRTNRNLAAIAAEAGFSSHAHMVTAFQRVLGTTPSRWAEMAARNAKR